MRHPVPAPALIDGVEWSVRDSGDPRTAYVDFTNKMMVVPLDCGPVGDLLRNHEMAHVAITPRSAKRFKELAAEFPNRTLQAVEDARVYVALNRAGIDVSAAHWPESDIAGVVALGDSPAEVEEKSRCLIAVTGTGDYPSMRAKMPAELVANVERLFAEYFGPDIAAGKLPSFEQTIALARELHVSAEEEEGESKGSSESEGEPDDEDGEDAPASPDSVPAEDSTKGESTTPGERPDGETDVARPFVPGDIANDAEKPTFKMTDLTDSELEMLSEILGNTRHGSGKPLADTSVDIEKPNLTVKQTGKGFGNKKVCSDTGAIPRRLGRYATDGAVFGRTIKGGYAAVLIDVSGSMSLSIGDVESMIAKLPHATIAQYSGSTRGAIVVLAKDGKRVASIPRSLGGNVCDMQALEWLAKQRGPRYWVCDGIVTGRDDAPLDAMSRLRLGRIAQLANVKRFKSCDDLFAGLTQKRL